MGNSILIAQDRAKATISTFPCSMRKSILIPRHNNFIPKNKVHYLITFSSDHIFYNFLVLKKK